MNGVDTRLTWLSARKKESENDAKAYQGRWARNIKLSKGIPLEDKSTRSEVRQRNKIYFRKIWSIVWRLVAAFYNAFLRDSLNFKLDPVDTLDDPRKVSVLFKVVKYRYRRMMRKAALFQKHVWAFFDIANLGLSTSKLSWEYDEKLGKDGPKYTSYPPEQVILDWRADTKYDMEYYGFDNYMTYAQMEANGYLNLDKAVKASPSNEVRNVRNAGMRDPIQNPGSNEYPSAGRYQEGAANDDAQSGLFMVTEWFYREDGKWKMCATHGNKAFAKDPIDSPYGDTMTLVLGICLTEPHKLVGEGFPEPMEGPQESYNFNINMRKDNVALALNPPTLISRYGNVDMNALTNRTPGKGVLVDDKGAVEQLDVQDVTQSSYKEGDQDVAQMQDVSGIVSAIEGQSDAGSATETQVNLSQGTAKLDLYTAIVAETYFADFVTTLTELVKRFETDEKILQICQDELTLETGVDHGDVYDLDIEADVEITVGLNVGKENELRQNFLILDRGAMYNQSMTALLQMGATPPEGVKLFNGLAVFEDILKITGRKDFQRYWVMMPPPPQAQTPGQKLAGSMPGNEVLAGMGAPQPGPMANMQPPNELQGGSAGGM